VLEVKHMRSTRKEKSHELVFAVVSYAVGPHHEIGSIPHQLTPALKAILKNIQDGIPNRKIALNRGTSSSTVKKQIGKIFEHFGVSSKSELALKFVSNTRVEAILSTDDRVGENVVRRGDCAVNEARALWAGFVRDPWSLVDRFDSDGRRYLVVFRNGYVFLDPRALSPEEAQTCRLLAHGHANKCIADELMLPISTVATHIANAHEKLRASSRFDLIQILHCLFTDTEHGPKNGP